MIPAAILSVIIQARGVAAANRAIMGVEGKLRKAEKAAVDATKQIEKFGRTTATAKVSVDVTKARRDLAALRREVAAAGRQRSTSRVSLDARQAVKEIAAVKRALGGLRAARVVVSARVAQALRDLAAVKRAVDAIPAIRRVQVHVHTTHTSSNAGGGGGGGGPPSTSGAGAGGAAAASGLSALAPVLAILPGGFSRLGKAIALVVPLLFAVIGPAFALGAALAPLAALAAGAAGGMFTLAQGLGVFMLATKGVIEALKEQTSLTAKAGTSSARQAAQEVASARAIEAAQEGVRSAKENLANAVRVLAEAQRNEDKATRALAPAYAEARRQLVDMRRAVGDAEISLRSARFAAQDARAALAALVAGADPKRLADAHRDVASAVRGERDAVRGLADAHRALNELLAPPDVLDLADAQDAVADATRNQQRAQLALNDALAASAGLAAAGGGTPDAAARAALELADAQNAVGDASRDSARAAQDLARMESGATAGAIADARLAIADAEAAVADARQDTAAAQGALAGVEAGATDGEVARARLDVAAAEHAVTGAVTDSARAVADLAAADKAGVRNAAAVVAAREALRSASLATAEAERGLAGAHREVAAAQRAVRDAQADAASSSALAASAAGDLNAKFDALPPAAQAFVRQLISMRPLLADLRSTAASGFFPGASEGLRAATGSFEPFKRVVAATSAVLGDLMRRGGELVGGGAFGADIQTIGLNNARVLDTMGGATLHLLSAFRHIMVVAGPLTQWLADVAEKWSLNAAEATKAGRENGKMAAFFERAIAVAQRLGSILSHLGGGIMGLGRASRVSGDSILASIDRTMQKFDEWANSVEGQRSIADFFRRSQELAAALIPALAGITEGLAALVLRLLPVTGALKILGPVADELIVAFVYLKLAMTAFAVASKLWAAAAAIAAFATGGWTTAFWALNAAIAANPIGAVILLVIALAAGLVLLYHKSETFRAIVDTAFAGVATAFGWIWQAAQDVFGWLKRNWPLVLAILTGPIGLAVLYIARHWSDIKAQAAAAWSAIKSAAGTAWNAIKVAVTTPIGVARDIVVGIVSALGTALSTAWAGIKSVAKAAWEAVSGFILTPLRAARDAAGDVLTGIVNRAQAAWEDIKRGVASFGANIRDAIVGAFEGAAKKVLGFVNGIIGVVNKLLGAIGVDKIPLVKVDKDATGGTFARSGGAPGATQMFARGGAFARTSGLVSSPITLMGEEAPRHPEYVIPTNPAYRGRAQSLLGQAAGAIGMARDGQGFATGGMYSQAQMAALWRSQGGGDAAIAGAVGMAESGGDPNAANGPYHGLWQVGPGGPFDPAANARAGIAKWRAGGDNVDLRWRPWEAYTGPDGRGSDGPWRKFAGGGGGDGGGGVGGFVSGLVGKVGGFLGDVMEQGASLVSGKLPGVGDLPEWLRDGGKWLLGKVGSWIKDTVAGIGGGGGEGAGTGPAPAGGPGTVPFDGIPIAKWIAPILASAREAGVSFRVSSGFRSFEKQTQLWNQLGQDPAIVARPGTSNHEGSAFPRGAVDVSPGWAELAAHLQRIGSPLKHYSNPRDPYHFSATGHAKGGIYSGVMGSYEHGTSYVPQTGVYELHRGEGVVTAAENKIADYSTEDRLNRESMDRLAAAIEGLIDSGHAGAIDALAEVVNERVGFGAGQRRASSANPSNVRFIL